MHPTVRWIWILALYEYTASRTQVIISESIHTVRALRTPSYRSVYLLSTDNVTQSKSKQGTTSQVNASKSSQRTKQLNMGCSESKETAETAVNGSATTPASATTTPTPTTTTTKTVNSYKAFRDPSMTLRKIIDHSTQMVVGAATKSSTQAANRAHHVRNIFATPLTDIELHNYTPPVHPKDVATTTFIETALQHNFVFESLSVQELHPLVQAFESYTVPTGDVIITQGDVGDYFYIIQTGVCVFQVDGREVGRAAVGNSFGELALLYTCPRAATVTATEDTTLYRVDQKTFRFILQNQTVAGSQNKGELLQGVDFLKDLDVTELFKLASVMTPKRFFAGDLLIKKGDMADYFYLVSEGTLVATDIAVGDTVYEDIVLKPGMYVGERALVTGEPRAANVVAKTDGMAFCIDKETFETVLGKLSVLIMRSQDKVKLVRTVILCVSHVACVRMDPVTTTYGLEAEPRNASTSQNS
jgi:cAMP-dependent protein kinase regulator